VNGLKGVPFCTGFTPTNGQALTLTTASSPNPCYTAATPAGSGTVNSGSSYAPTYYPSPGGTAVSGATPFSGIQYDSTSAPPAAATAAQVVAVIGSTAVTNATNAVNFSGSLSGDVTGTQSATSVVKVNGASVPTSKTIVGTNSSGQIVDASSATLSNNTTGTAAGLTSYPTKCTGINFSQGLSSGSNNCTAPVNSSGVYSACDLATETPGTYYCAINPGVVEVSATESQVQQPIPFTATMNNLYVRLTADPGNGNTVTVTQRISGSSQSLSCTITGNGSTNTTCSDTTHTDVFSGAGQSFDWQVVTVGVSTDTQLYISVRSLSY
jgi:hypothetical protein